MLQTDHAWPHSTTLSWNFALNTMWTASIAFVWFLLASMIPANDAADIYVTASPSMGFPPPSCGSNASYPCATIQSAVNLPSTHNGDVILLLNDGIYVEGNVTISKDLSIASANGTVTWTCPSSSCTAVYLDISFAVNDNNRTAAIVSWDCLQLQDIAFQSCMV